MSGISGLASINRNKMKEPDKLKMIGFLLFVVTTANAVEPLMTRLVGGSGSFEGRVEVYYQGAWGTVCDDDWDLDDAHVVCHTLGYSHALAFYHSANFGQGTGEIILDDVQCTGSESNIAFCQHNGYLSENCVHYEDAGVTCDVIDIDECERTGDEYPCDALNGQCTNTQGSYVCSCSTGYRLDLNDNCQEINECERTGDEYPCDALSGQCTNTQGSYVCSCSTGYRLDPIDNCQDIDECERTGDEYPCDALNGQCTNTQGSYVCSCSTGYRLDLNDNCQDIDECERTGDEYPCDALNGQCTNTQGSYVCSCSTGYRLDPIDNCQDIGECDEYPCDALNGQCTNTQGSYVCSCSTGYRLDPIDNCQDIDECELTGDEYPCDAINGQCTNTQGSYVCSCSTGYRLDTIDNCQEVDQKSSTTNGSKMGLSQPVTFGLMGVLSAAVVGILLGCIVMTVMMRKYRRSANEASSQQQVSYPQTVEQNCYNGPQLDEEGYLELSVVPPKLPGGSSRDKGEAYETPRHDDNEDAYENIQIQE